MVGEVSQLKSEVFITSFHSEVFPSELKIHQPQDDTYYCASVPNKLKAPLQYPVSVPRTAALEEKKCIQIIGSIRQFAFWTTLPTINLVVRIKIPLH